MTRYVALLRGINLGNTRRVGMGELRELLATHGYEDVRTHLQSGNVVLSSPLSPRTLEAQLMRQLAKGLGLDVEVLVRTRPELAKVVERNPLGDVATNNARYLVRFLAKRLPARVVRDLEAADVAPELLIVDGRELFTWHPDGVQRSPLDGFLVEKRLGVVSTARNWNTVTRLLELVDE